MTEDDLVASLVRLGYLRPEARSQGALALERVSRRHENMKVVDSTGPSYFVKRGLDSHSQMALRREAAIYTVLSAAQAGGSSLSSYLLHCYGYDEAERVLVFDLLDRAEDLSSYHKRLGRFPVTLAARLGTAVAALHATRKLALPEVEGDGTPFALSIHRPSLSSLRYLSAANMSLIKIVQSSPEHSAQLDELRRGWQVQTAIHGDLRWDNCLVSQQPMRELKLVDWELARNGDPLWDVGCVFANYLRAWVLSMPVLPELDAHALAKYAHKPLEKMQPTIRAFWAAYRRGAGDSTLDPGMMAITAAQYLGARLLEIAYSLSQTSYLLSSSALIILQLSRNILQDPRDAVVHLLGLSLRDEARL